MGGRVEPVIPPAKRGGRPRARARREVLNAIFYLLSTGCQWQALLKDLPPRITARFYFMLRDWGLGRHAGQNARAAQKVAPRSTGVAPSRPRVTSVTGSVSASRKASAG